MAIDKDGDFVVTWAGLQHSGLPSNDWDVYAETFYANGNVHTSTFMVNTTTLGTQRAPSVAMDLRGDFVITWESRTSITSSTGYDIEAKRFSYAGNVMAGTDEEQSITFDTAFSGTFAIRWDDDNNPNTPDKVTGAISFAQQGAFAAAADVQAALEAIGADVDRHGHQRHQAGGDVRRQRQLPRRVVALCFAGRRPCDHRDTPRRRSRPR